AGIELPELENSVQARFGAKAEAQFEPMLLAVQRQPPIAQPKGVPGQHDAALQGTGHVEERVVLLWPLPQLRQRLQPGRLDAGIARKSAKPTLMGHLSRQA